MCSTDRSVLDDKSTDKEYDDDESSSGCPVSVTECQVSVTDGVGYCDNTRKREQHVPMIDQTGVCHKTEINDALVSIIDPVCDNRKRKPQNASYAACVYRIQCTLWSTVTVGLLVVMLVALCTWTVREQISLQSKLTQLSIKLNSSQAFPISSMTDKEADYTTQNEGDKKVSKHS